MKIAKMVGKPTLTNWGMSMKSILKLLTEKPRILYIAVTDGRYGGAMAVGDGIKGIHCVTAKTEINQL